MALIATDVASAAAAFVVAFNLRSAEVRTGGLYLPRSGTLITVALWLVCAQALGAFDLRRSARPVASIRTSPSCNMAESQR